MEQNPQQNSYVSKREERERTLRAEQRKRKLIKLSKWGVGTVVMVLAIAGLYKLVVKSSGPMPGEFFKAQSRDHIEAGALHADYNSNPPTGGWHYEQPVQSGIYGKELSDESVLHNLEHGHVWIAYQPDLPKEQVDALAKIASGYGSKIVMEPRAANDAPIALIAWERLLKLDAVDEPQIKAFIDAYRGRGPENVPDSGFKDFR